MYFVTICATQRRCIFGQIHGNDIVLSRTGEIIRTCWIEIPRHFPNVKIETYVVMPNHLHGILTIDSKLPDANTQNKLTGATELFGRPSPRSIPTIIRSFKAAASKRVRESGLVISEYIWQRGYFEHVLRDTREYIEITNYILQNPARWAEDEENPNKKLD
jgi:putative transposase